jgi:hypothetical protein
VHGHCSPLHSGEGDSSRIKLGGIRFVLRSGEDVSLFSPTNISEARVLQNPFPLCFQQSTGDSAAPEVDIVLSVLWYLFVDNDVRNLDAPAELEHPVDLLHDRHLVGTKINDAITDHGIY